MIADQWDEALLHYEYATVHLSSDYIMAIWQADDGALNPHIFIIYDGDNIAGLAAIDKSKYIYRSIPIRAAIPLDYERYGRADAIMFDAAAADALYQAVRDIGVDIWHLDRFPKDSMMLQYCANNLSPSQFYPYEDNPLALINTNVSWEEYLAKKSKNFRRSYKRIKESSAALRTEFYAQGQGDVDKLLSDIRTINAQSWKNNAGSDFSQDRKRLQFFEGFMKKSRSKDALVVCILYDEDRPVSFTFGAVFQKKLYAIETGYVDGYADHSAGIMSYIHIMQYAFSHPDIIACDMDIIRANGGYKRRWADTIKTQSSAIIMFGGMGSLLIRTGRALSKMKNKLRR